MVFRIVIPKQLIKVIQLSEWIYASRWECWTTKHFNNTKGKCSELLHEIKAFAVGKLPYNIKNNQVLSKIHTFKLTFDTGGESTSFEIAVLKSSSVQVDVSIIWRWQEHYITKKIHASRNKKTLIHHTFPSFTASFIRVLSSWYCKLKVYKLLVKRHCYHHRMYMIL